MRERDRDPTEVQWVGVDIDATAVACCAVNVVLWGLGFRVLLGVGDALQDNWQKRAIRERAETIELARSTRMLDALQLLMHERPAADEPEPDTTQPPADSNVPAPDQSPATADPVGEPADTPPHPRESSPPAASGPADQLPFWEAVDLVAQT